MPPKGYILQEYCTACDRKRGPEHPGPRSRCTFACVQLAADGLPCGAIGKSTSHREGCKHNPLSEGHVSSEDDEASPSETKSETKSEFGDDPSDIDAEIARLSRLRNTKGKTKLEYGKVSIKSFAFGESDNPAIWPWSICTCQ